MPVSEGGFDYGAELTIVLIGGTPAKTPIYRLVNLTSGDHFYTADPVERDNAVSTYGYTYEEIAFYADASPLVENVDMVVMAPGWHTDGTSIIGFVITSTLANVRDVIGIPWVQVRYSTQARP